MRGGDFLLCGRGEEQGRGGATGGPDREEEAA